jgi:hypothetical protein
MSKTEVGIQHIQKQVDNCDKIIDNIDIIVPKLYKIRQQVLAQKDYINDVSRNLLTTGSDLDSGTAEGVFTLKSNGLGTTLVQAYWAIDVWNTGNAEKNREVIQSLFKYKHEIGTSNHFTTEQIGLEGDREAGLNLRDVVDITTGLNNLLTASNSTPATNSTLTKIILKSDGSINPDGTNSLVSTVSGKGYGPITDGDLPTNLDSATGAISGNIVGFGLT